MTLEEMLAEAKRRWPKKDINCARYLTCNDGQYCEWWHLSVNNIAQYNGPSINGSSPEDALSKIVLPDRISEARMMIDKANEILREEGVADGIALYKDGSFSWPGEPQVKDFPATKS
jgi:hypothetical protein